MVGYFSLNHFEKYNTAQAFLLGMSLWFYGFFNYSYLLIIIASILVNYLLTWYMVKTRISSLRRLAFIGALIFNIGILFYYKYFDFFVENLNIIFHADFVLKNLLLPLGISFFTFQQLSYVIDVYRDKNMERYNFLQYASFVAYFPQLIAGPIVTHDELVPQFGDLSKKKFNWDNFSSGLYIFVLGLAKKVLIADTFGIVANYGFSNIASMDTTNAILVTLAYTVQIYFDFSGYCDMAIGIGKMMNIDLPVNFDSPYKSLTILEFWKRWHKTLTRFFTKYIYIPLGGNRKGNIRTYVNVLVVFFVSGVWHGANWTFILWGTLHGIFNVITRHWKTWFDKLHPALSWLVTFTFINFTWIFFRADTIKDSLLMINKILQLNFGPIHTSIIEAFNLVEIKVVLTLLLPENIFNLYPNMLVLIAFIVVLVIMLGSKNAYERMTTFRPSLLNFILILLLLIWCIMSFSGVSTFLYFNF